MTGIEWIVYAIVAMVLSIAAYMLAPKPPKQSQPPTSDLNNPTVSAGRPVPVIFGTVTMKSPNILWYGDKRKKEYKVKA